MNIKNIIDGLKAKKPGAFLDESHFRFEFLKELIRQYPFTKNIEFEKNYGGKRIDLYVEYNGKKYCFEFKYFTKKMAISILPDVTIWLKNQVCKDLARIEYWEDIARLQELVSQNKIDYGCCILMTNDSKVFNHPLQTLDKEFELKPGIEQPNKKIYRDTKGDIKHEANIIKEVELFKEQYNNDFIIMYTSLID